MTPRSRRIAGAVGLGLGAALVALVFGADGWRVAGWGLTVAALVLLRGLPAGSPLPSVRDPERNRGRSDVDQLAWSMVEQGDRVRSAVLRRVAAVAAQPLADRGLDAARPGDAAAIDRLLGAGAAAALQADDRRPVDLEGLGRLLTGIERLGTTEVRA